MDTEQGFKKKLTYHQWPDNYCDFSGMAGDNFTNYGVLKDDYPMGKNFLVHLFWDTMNIQNLIWSNFEAMVET